MLCRPKSTLLLVLGEADPSLIIVERLELDNLRWIVNFDPARLFMDTDASSSTECLSINKEHNVHKPSLLLTKLV